MTREEAIEKLKHERDEDIFAPTFYRDKIHEALTMAIEALSEPTIPLSVIEKIKADVEKEIKHSVTSTRIGTLKCVKRIIDKAVKEIK